MKKPRTGTGKELSVEVKVPVRFSEVDSMGVVWHGNYVKFLEDGREAFGEKYGLNYLDHYHQGYFTPLVHVQCDFKIPVSYGEQVMVKATYVDQKAAKIHYLYEVRRFSDNELCAEGETTQIFMDHNRELCLTIPEYFQEWKRKWGLLPNE